MNFVILILIVVLILLYAAAQVIPIGGMIVSVVGIGLAITLDVYLRKRKQKIEQTEEQK